MFYYNHHIGDHAQKTSHLSLLEHGVFTVLLDWQMRNETALPTTTNVETIYRLCRASKPAERRAVDFILAEFFPDNFNKWARDQISAYHKQAEANRKAAHKRWHSEGYAGALPPDAGALPPDSGCSAPPMPTSNHEPVTSNQEPAAAEAAAASAEIPSVEEVKTWAEMSGIPPEYAENLHRKTTDDHMWVRAGKLANWRKRWQDFWVQDRESWGKNGARGAEKRGRDEVPPAPGFGLTIEKMKTAV